MSSTLTAFSHSILTPTLEIDSMRDEETEDEIDEVTHASLNGCQGWSCPASAPTLLTPCSMTSSVLLRTSTHIITPLLDVLPSLQILIMVQSIHSQVPCHSSLHQNTGITITQSGWLACRLLGPTPNYNYN